MLTLTEQDIKQLNDFLQEMPLKHGLPLLNFFNAKAAEQQKQNNVGEQPAVIEEKTVEE
jgi:hypothetical protein